ncbi:helix-turn-helix domain-containing protein [Enterococcus lactis]|uniref:helix-turn-helix domain-containing protein n=1 Tax=Enterococcus lactis TaxID=357441 RepID=UPI0040437325
MIRLIYEKSSQNKIKIIRLLLENKGAMTKKQLLLDLGVSSITLEKYINEIRAEISPEFIEEKNNIFTISNNICNLYEIQLFYLSESIVKDILEICFFSNCSTFEKVAQQLFISPSKLFNVIKFMNKCLEKINIIITKTPYVTLEGKAESVLILYNLYLRLSTNIFSKTFVQVDSSTIYNFVYDFFKKNRIKQEERVIKEFITWILTVNDRKYLKKFFTTSINTKNKEHFIDLKCTIFNQFNFFQQYYWSSLDEEDGKELLLSALFFQSMGLHFENEEAEIDFFKKIKLNSKYKNSVLPTLIKKNYNLQLKNIDVVALKIIGSIYFANLLYPFYFFYGNFFNPTFKNADCFKSLVSMLKSDFCEHNVFNDIIFNDEIYEYLAYVIRAFQKNNISSKQKFTVGVCSIKGNFFEQQFSEELKKSISIIPYYNLESNENIDLLIIDDLRLLDTSINYTNYRLIDN